MTIAPVGTLTYNAKNYAFTVTSKFPLNYIYLRTDYCNCSVLVLYCTVLYIYMASIVLSRFGHNKGIAEYYIILMTEEAKWPA